MEHAVRGHAVLLGQWLTQHQGQQLPCPPAEDAGLRGGLQWLQDLLPARLLHVGRRGSSGKLTEAHIIAFLIVKTQCVLWIGYYGRLY